MLESFGSESTGRHVVWFLEKQIEQCIPSVIHGKMERDLKENKPGNGCRNPDMNYEMKKMDKSGKHGGDIEGLVDRKGVVHTGKKRFEVQDFEPRGSGGWIRPHKDERI